jgi:hypothetical protein
LRKLLAKRVRKKKRNEVNAEDDVEVQMQHQQQRSEMEMAPEREVVTWQMPVMFLTSATICMIVGLFLHIWSATPHVGRMGTWDDDSKVRTSTVYSLFQPTVTAKGRLEGCQYERDGVMEQETLSLSGH